MKKILFPILLGSVLGSQCWASNVKSTIKSRNDQEDGPISSELVGEKRLVEIANKGVIVPSLGSTDDDGERVALHVICKCEKAPHTAADGGSRHGAMGLREVPCEGTLPLSRVHYEVRKTGTCYAGAIRSSQRHRAVVSSLLLSAGEAADITPGAAAIKDVPPKGRVFEKNSFRLGGYGYYDVCNGDARVEDLDLTRRFTDKKALKTHRPRAVEEVSFYL